MAVAQLTLDAPAIHVARQGTQTYVGATDLVLGVRLDQCARTATAS